MAPDMSQAIRHIKSIKNPRIWLIAVILSSYFGVDVYVKSSSDISNPTRYLVYKAWCRSWSAFFASLVGSLGVVILALRQSLGQYQSSVRTLEALCSKIQKRAIKEFQPDVVIGMLFLENSLNHTKLPLGEVIFAFDS